MQSVADSGNEGEHCVLNPGAVANHLDEAQLDRWHQLAAAANAVSYDTEATRRYVSGAPHLKHAALTALHDELIVRVFATAKRHADVPRVLDLGAGEGSTTLPFLRLGAAVTAVDISPSQIEALTDKCAEYRDRLEVRCEDLDIALERSSPKYDAVAASALLHHVPDYLTMIRKAVNLLNNYGQFFSFQDPLRYDSLRLSHLYFSRMSYVAWRLTQGDVIGGARRRLRRNRGRFQDDCVADNAEFHALRNGVDQQAIQRVCHEIGMTCSIVTYFSTQSRLFQRIGATLGIENTFAVIAQRIPAPTPDDVPAPKMRLAPPR